MTLPSRSAGRRLPKLDDGLQKESTAVMAGGRASPQLSRGLLDLDYLYRQNYPLEETAACGSARAGASERLRMLA